MYKIYVFGGLLMKKILACFTIGLLTILLVSCSPTPETVTYTVIFDTDGGTEISSVVVEEELTVHTPIDPIKEGYSFRGWYTAPYNIGFEYNFYSPVRSNIIIYAWWIQNEE